MQPNMRDGHLPGSAEQGRCASIPLYCGAILQMTKGPVIGLHHPYVHAACTHHAPRAVRALHCMQCFLLTVKSAYLPYSHKDHDGVHAPALHQTLEHSRHLEGCLRVYQCHAGVAVYWRAVANPVPRAKAGRLQVLG